MRSSLLALAAAAGAAGCASYAAAPPLAFEAIPYDSLQGEPWQVKTVELPKTAELYDLPRPPRMAYVELNPKGERTVILIHGLGSYLKYWRYQVDELAEQGLHVVAADMIGYGKSDKPATFPYTMESMADAIRELAQATNAVKPVLVGHSMGGQTALSFAIRYPEEVGGLILVSPAGFERFSQKEKLWFDSVITVSAIRFANEDSIWGSIRRANFMRWKDDLEWMIEERVRLAKAPDFSSYAYANVRSVQGLARNDFVRDNLDRVKAPTLIVYGEMDRLIPNPFLHGGTTQEIMDYGQSKIPGAKVVPLAGCGHMLQMDCPDLLNRQIQSFLSKGS